MKKLFSLLLALVLVSSNFSVAFAGESTSRSAEEIQAEMQKVREELKKETLKNRISTRSAETLSTEEIIERESATLPLKNKLADLDYELAIKQNNIIPLEKIKSQLSHHNSFRSYQPYPKNHFFQTGDIILFYRPGSYDAFSLLSHGYTHSILIVNSEYGIDTTIGQKSKLKPLSKIFSDSYLQPYTKVLLKRFDNNIIQASFMADYANTNLLGKLYPNIVNILSTAHSKESLFELYCSQIPWLAYRATRQIDIDNDGGPIVFPVDILNSSYGTTYAIK